MRIRLTQVQRRAAILEEARGIFTERGFGATEMEHIRLACGISRGGLYHHFSNKRAILDALVDLEIGGLAEAIERSNESPITVLLRQGSQYLDGDSGLLAGLTGVEEREEYLSSLDRSLLKIISPILCRQLKSHVKKHIDPCHVAELFLTINAHINRRQLLGDWSPAETARFSATALRALESLLRRPADLTGVIANLQDASLTH